MSSKAARFSRRLAVMAGVALLLAACSSATPEQRLQQAEEYEASGRYQAAILELRNALQQDPELAEGRRRLGMLFLRVGDHLSAIAELERAERLGIADDGLDEALARARVASGDPRHARRVVDAHGLTRPEELSVSLGASLGQALQLIGRNDSAQELLTSLVERAPDHPEGRLALARFEWAQGRPAAALQHANAAVESAPGNQQAWLLRGELQLALGEADAARDSFDNAVNLAESGERSKASARLGLARALLASGDYDGAKPLVAAVLSELPELPAAHYLNAMLKLQEGDLTAARTSLEVVIRAAPDHMPSRYFRAVVAFRESRFERARDDLDRVVARNPENLNARLLLAAVHSETDAHSRGVDVLRAGLRVPGAEPDAAYYAALGQSLLRTGAAEEGLEMLGRAASQAPDAAVIRTQFALAQLATGATGSAEAELQGVADLTDSFPLSDTLLILLQLEGRRFDEALSSARRFVERNPEAPMAYNMLGAAYLGKEQVDDARKTFERALEVDPDFSPAVLNLAAVDRQAGDLAGARARLTAVVERDPENRAARLRLAEIAHQQGDLPAAISTLRQGWETDRTEQQLSITLARLHLENEEPARAIDVLGDLGNNEQAADQVLAVRGQAGLQAGRTDYAVAAFEALLERRPDDTQVSFALVGALANAGESERAFAVLERQVMELDGTPTQILVFYADLLIRNGDHVRAEEIIDELAGRDNSAFSVALLHGELALRRDDVDAAIVHLGQAHAEQPSANTLRRLQVARAQAGRAEEGQAQLEAWVADNPADGLARGMLAELRLTLHEYDDAIREYESLLEQTPDNVAVLNNLAWLYGQVGREDAIPMARRALALAPQLAPVQDTLGWLLVQAGQVEEGIGLLQQAAAGSPDDPDIQYHYAVALEQTGLTAEAREALQRALLNSGFDREADAREMLERLGG